jgi:hypothetical protein
VSLVPLGWIDVYELACSLRSRIGLFPKSGAVRTLQIRGPKGDADPEDDAGFVWTRGARDRWPELNNTLAETERVVPDIEWGRIVLELLMPNGIVPLAADTSEYGERYVRAHLPIRTNPAALLICGGACVHLAQGAISMLATKRAPLPTLPVGAMNLGEKFRVHLIADFRKKDPAP